MQTSEYPYPGANLFLKPPGHFVSPEMGACRDMDTVRCFVLFCVFLCVRPRRHRPLGVLFCVFLCVFVFCVCVLSSVLLSVFSCVFVLVVVVGGVVCTCACVVVVGGAPPLPMMTSLYPLYRKGIRPYSAGPVR